MFVYEVYNLLSTCARRETYPLLGFGCGVKSLSPVFELDFFGAESFGRDDPGGIYASFFVFSYFIDKPGEFG